MLGLLALQGSPVRFWLEEYAFGEGETILLREQIKVRALLTAHCITVPDAFAAKQIASLRRCRPLEGAH